MDIAIIGAGNVGRALTSSALRAGHSVAVSSDKGESAATLAQETGARAASSNRDAADGAELVVLAVPYTAVDGIIDEMRPALAGKIVVDATNPLNADASGLVTEGTSAAERIQALAPEARVVKAFNTALAARQASPTVSDLRVDGFVAADDAEAKATVLNLVDEMGFNPVDAGDLIRARELEALAFLNISLQLRHGWSWQAGWKLVGPGGDAS